VIVSEQTGNISVAVGGRMTRDLDPVNVSKFLEGMFSPKTVKYSFADTVKKVFKGNKEK